VQLRQIIAKAREENDVNTELEAQERLSALSGEQRQVASWLQTQHEAVEQHRNAPVQQAPVQQQPQRPVPSPRAEEWAEQNSWFGQDRVMTYAAWGIHQTLVEQEGVDPASDEYYTELDKRVRSTFPDKFSQPRQQRSAPAVAPAARSSGINSARRTVRLSPSQVAIAKKLGVPLEEYAKYVKE
jgi:phage I-like protein